MTDNKDPHIFCPFCNNRLVYKGMRPLETLVEHVMCVDEDIEDKPAWGCPSPSCEANKADATWTESGEGPFIFGNESLWETQTIDGYLSAGGSSYRQYDVGIHQHNIHGKKGKWDWNKG